MAEPTAHLSVVRDVKQRLATSPTTVRGRMVLFKEHLEREELAPRTVREYCRLAQNADWWCEQHGYTLRNVPSVVLGEYVAVRPKSNGTRRGLRAMLTQYWKCFKRKDPPLWMVKVPRKPRMVCRALEPHEAAALSKVAIEHGGREGLAVLFAMYQGLRREEISAVAWHDISDDGWLQLVGKGDQPAKLPLHPLVAEALAALLREHPIWVFPGRPFVPDRGKAGGGDRHANPATVWHWVSRLAKESGIGHVPPHRLRHTALATANDNTGDLRAVQDFARHSRPDTTAGYTRTTVHRLTAAIQSISYAPGAVERASVERDLLQAVKRITDEELSVVTQLVKELVVGAGS